MNKVKTPTPPLYMMLVAQVDLQMKGHGVIEKAYKVWYEQVTLLGDAHYIALTQRKPIPKEFAQVFARAKEILAQLESLKSDWPEETWGIPNYTTNMRCIEENGNPYEKDQVGHGGFAPTNNNNKNRR